MRRSLVFLFALFACAGTAIGEEIGREKPLQRIAFGSCNKDDKSQPLWKPILAAKADLWVWLGDIVYARADDLEDLERRYRSLKEHADYKALRAQTRVVGIYDDNDFMGRSRKAESQRLLLDFLDEPRESPRRPQAGAYASYVFGPAGKQVKLLLLDERFHRDVQGGDMLGAEQWSWLEQQLAGSTADVHLIGSGIQVIATEHGYDKWADFAGARRLFKLMAKIQPRNLIFLSGDRHLGEISRLIDVQFPHPIYDITSSGMTHHAKDWWFRKNFSQEPNQYRLGSNFLGLNFGIVEFNWETSPPTATLQIRDTSGAVKIEEKITLSPAAVANP